MSRAVMLSINPKWYYWISINNKLIELRKSRPKLQVPFKVYLYVTKVHVPARMGWGRKACDYGGFVAGEFTCDNIMRYEFNKDYGACSVPKKLLDLGHLTIEEVMDYAKKKTLYAWHISDLKIYSKPKKLNSFYRYCVGLDDCGMCWDCEHAIGEEHDCGRDSKIFLEKPPQSWEYVDGEKQED